jgi:hypothetical protein
LGEWGLTNKQIFSQESKQDGELYAALSKRFNVIKPQKGQFIKSDLKIINCNLEIPIEITTAKDNKGLLNRSRIKSCEIGDRLYHGLKWANTMNSPYFLVIHKSWKKAGWLKKDEDWLKEKKVYILYTSFLSRWANKIAKDIGYKILA